MQVRYIEIKTSPEGQTIKAYTPAQYKKEMTRRKNAAARARKLTRLPTGFTGRPTKRSGRVNPYKDMTLAARRARESRWNAKTCARVVHPRFGEVIVPHTSNYAAMLNAAEYWGCDWLEIIDDVKVWAVGPDAVPVKMPRHERNRR